MSRGGNNMTKLEAVEYLKEVRMRFEDKEKFMEFLKIITEYRVRRMSVGSVVEKVEEFLKGHHDLISGFNNFLPKGYEILLPPKGPVQLEDAIRYVQKVKDRFEDTDDTYKAFVKILTDRNKNGMSVGEVYHEASVVYVFV
ncbi:hypothetical protein PHAVU_003G056500, partial [Phaseolus vulgaris]|uniref:Histone deacetylase interacting domain-containing protein n=2 Tax=Phaseolus vulgaris TaxID=3885 RepID=V7C699_PHAVU|nr:hypothetical protein PHAVU_003G056500g [Phaseolus vulgaris]ESW25682.1 hypothetical protein PHAVU_003G056500g [Phaseolus vulgaris]